MSKKVAAYTACYRYDRDDGVWLAAVEEMAHVHSYGSTLAEAEAHLRDALGLFGSRLTRLTLTIRRS